MIVIIVCVWMILKETKHYAQCTQPNFNEDKKSD